MSIHSDCYIEDIESKKHVVLTCCIWANLAISEAVTEFHCILVCAAIPSMLTIHPNGRQVILQGLLLCQMFRVLTTESSVRVKSRKAIEDNALRFNGKKLKANLCIENSKILLTFVGDTVGELEGESEGDADGDFDGEDVLGAATGAEVLLGLFEGF